MNDLRGLLFLMLFGLPSIATVNLECRTHFKCLDETHFHICVDFGDGTLRTIDTVVFPCPPRMICDETNKNECHLPIITTTTQMSTLATVNEKISTILPDTVTLGTIPSFVNNSISLESSTNIASTLGAVSTDASTQTIVLQTTQQNNHTAIQDLENSTDIITTTETNIGYANANDVLTQTNTSLTASSKDTHQSTSTKIYDQVNRNDTDITQDMTHVDISTTTADPNIMNATTQNIISKPKHHNTSTEFLISVNIMDRSTTEETEHKNKSHTMDVPLTTTYISDDDFRNKVYTTKDVKEIDKNKTFEIIDGNTDTSIGNNKLNLNDVTSTYQYHPTDAADKTKTIDNNLNDKMDTTDAPYVSSDPPTETPKILYSNDSVNFVIKSKEIKSTDNANVLSTKSKSENKENYKSHTKDVSNSKSYTPTEATVLTTTYILDDLDDLKKKVYMSTTEENKKIVKTNDIIDVTTYTLIESNTLNPTEAATSTYHDLPIDAADKTKTIENKLNDKMDTTDVPYVTSDPPTETSNSFYSSDSDFGIKPVESKSIDRSSTISVRNEKTTTEHMPGNLLNSSKQEQTSINIMDTGKTNHVLYTTTDSPTKTTTLKTSYLFESAYTNNNLVKPNEKNIKSTVAPDLNDTVQAISVMLLNNYNPTNTTVKKKSKNTSHMSELSIESTDNHVNVSNLSTITENQQINRTNIVDSSNATDSKPTFISNSTSEFGYHYITDMRATTDIPNITADTVSVSIYNFNLIKFNITAETMESSALEEYTTPENAFLNLKVDAFTENTTVRFNISSNASESVPSTPTLENTFLNVTVDERAEKLVITTQHPYIPSLNYNHVHPKVTTTTEQSTSENYVDPTILAKVTITSTEPNGLYNSMTHAITPINSTQTNDIYNKTKTIYTKNTNAIVNDSLTDLPATSFESEKHLFLNARINTGSKIQDSLAELKNKVLNYSVTTETTPINTTQAYMINSIKANIYENGTRVKETESFMNASVSTSTESNLTASNLRESSTTQNLLLSTITTETTAINSKQFYDDTSMKEKFTNVIPITSMEKHFITDLSGPDDAESSTTTKLHDPSANVVISTEKTTLQGDIKNIYQSSIDNSINLYIPDSTRVTKTNEQSLDADLGNTASVSTKTDIGTENYNPISAPEKIPIKEIKIDLDGNNKHIFLKATTGFQEPITVETTVSLPDLYETTEKNTIYTTQRTESYNSVKLNNGRMTEEYTGINKSNTSIVSKSPINKEIKVLYDTNYSIPSDITVLESQQLLNSTKSKDFVNSVINVNVKSTTPVVQYNYVSKSSDLTNKTASRVGRTADIIDINITELPSTQIPKKSIYPEFLLPSVKTNSFLEKTTDTINSTQMEMDSVAKNYGHTDNSTISMIQTRSTNSIRKNVTTVTENPLDKISPYYMVTNHTKNDSTLYVNDPYDKTLKSHSSNYTQQITEHVPHNTDLINISGTIQITEKSRDNQMLQFNTFEMNNSLIEHEAKQYISETALNKYNGQNVTENVHDVTTTIHTNTVEPLINGLLTDGTIEETNNKKNSITNITTAKHINVTKPPIVELINITKENYTNISRKPKPLGETSSGHAGHLAVNDTKSLDTYLHKTESYNISEILKEKTLDHAEHLTVNATKSFDSFHKNDSYVKNISQIPETENLNTRTPQPLKSITEFECVSEGRFSDNITINYYYICVKNGDHFIRLKFGCQQGYHVNQLSVKCQQNKAIQPTTTTKSSTENYITKIVPNHSTITNSNKEMESVDNTNETDDLEIVEITEATATVEQPKELFTKIKNSEVLVINTQSEEDTEADEEETSSINPNINIQSKLENVEPTTEKLPRQQELSNVEIFADNLNTKTKHDMPIIVVNIDTMQLTTIPTTRQEIPTESVGNLHEKKDGSQVKTMIATRIPSNYITSTTEAVKPTTAYKSTTAQNKVNTMVIKPATSMVIKNNTNFVCPDKKYTKYADNHDCRKVYICAGQIHPTVRECPVGTVFNDLRKQCTKILSHCIRNNEFQCPSEGRFHDIFNNLYYYICVKNSNHYIRYKLRCKNGYHVNEFTLKCELNKESTEQSSVSKSSNESSEKSTVSIKSEQKRSTEKQRGNRREGRSFKCVVEGKFPDPNNCRKYYACSKKDGRIRRKRKRCKRNEVFNKERRRCVNAETHKCE